VGGREGDLLLLEPLNRYEQHYLRKLSDAVRVIEKAGRTPGSACLADLFHMHIEESGLAGGVAGGGALGAARPPGGQHAPRAGTGDIDFGRRSRPCARSGSRGGWRTSAR
jgi:hypothetical protein